MPSSVPSVRSHSSASRRSSQYSLDLAALGGDDSFTGLSLQPRPVYDQIRSEDIDGPTDFTQNLEFWMRAPLNSFKYHSEDALKDYHGVHENDIGTTKGSLRASSEFTSKESHNVQHSLSPSASKELSEQDNMEAQASKHDGLPQTEDISTKHLEETKAQPNEVRLRPIGPHKTTSKDFQGEASPNSIGHDQEVLLQSKMLELVRQVEELNNRLNEQASTSQLRIAELETLLASKQVSLDKKTEFVESCQRDMSNLTKEHHAELSRIDYQWSQKVEATEDSHLNETLQQKGVFEQKLLEMQSLLNLKQTELDEINIVARNEKATLVQRVQELEKEIISYKEHVSRAAINQANSSAQNVAEEVETTDSESHMQTLASTYTRSQLPEEVRPKDCTVEGLPLPGRREPLISNGNETLSRLKDDLTIAKEKALNLEMAITIKNKEIAEEIRHRVHINNIYTSTKEHVASLEAGISGLRHQLEQSRLELEDTRMQARQAKHDREMVQDQLKEIQAEFSKRFADNEGTRRVLSKDAHSEKQVQRLNDELMLLREKHKVEIGIMRSRAEEAVNKAGALLVSEKTEKRSIKQKLTAAKQELEILRQQLGQDYQPSTVFETTVSTLQAELQVQQSAAVKASKEVEDLKVELMTLKEDYKNVNNAVNDRIVQLMQRREEELSRRLKALLKDRDLISRALMSEWGKEECGIGVPQQYRYKFVTK